MVIKGNGLINIDWYLRALHMGPTPDLGSERSMLPPKGWVPQRSSFWLRFFFIKGFSVVLATIRLFGCVWPGGIFKYRSMFTVNFVTIVISESQLIKRPRLVYVTKNRTNAADVRSIVSLSRETYINIDVRTLNLFQSRTLEICCITLFHFFCRPASNFFISSWIKKWFCRNIFSTIPTYLT